MKRISSFFLEKGSLWPSILYSRTRHWLWRVFFIIAFNLPFIAYTATNAKIQGFVLTADELYQDTENEFIELIGNVHILYQNQEIRSQKAVIFTKSKKAIFIGDVYIKSPQAEIEGDEVITDYDGDTGLIKNGIVKSNNIIFRGRTIQKLSAVDYYVLDASYTSCTNCPSTWAFDGSQIRAELGGYAYLKNTILKFGSVPVFWFPYLVLPINSQRESGLLPPALDYFDNTGTIVTLSYFWAINRSTDATFTLKNYELAGLKSLAEYRYVLSESSYGQLQTGYIHDRVFASEPRVNTYRSPDEQGDILDRWFIKYDHYYELPQNYVNRVEINLASDLQYSKDFPKETVNYGDSAMENRISFSKNTRDQHFSVDTSYYLNQLQADPLSGNDNAVHRLPALHFSQVNRPFGPFLFSFDADYTNFFRNGKAYDSIAEKDVNGSKVRYVANDKADPNCENQLTPCQPLDNLPYDPTKDIIRTGQRLELQPTLTYNFTPTPWLNVMPKVLYRETRYIFNVGDEKQNIRRYVRAEVSSRTKFSHVYGDFENPNSNRYKHEVIPQLTYTVVPWRELKNHPFFGFGQTAEAPFTSREKISNSDLNNNGLQFDYNDRLYDSHLITFSLLNKLIRRKMSGDNANYYNLANLRLEQSYDFFEASKKTKNKEPFSSIKAILEFNLPGANTVTEVTHFPYQKVADVKSKLKLYNDFGQFMKFGYTRNYTTLTPGFPVDSSTRTEGLSVAAGFTSGYINLMGGLVYNLNWANLDQESSKIKRITWITQLKPPGECWVINFARDQEIGGRPGWRLSYVFNFDGKPMPPLPPEALDEFGY